MEGRGVRERERTVLMAVRIMEGKGENREKRKSLHRTFHGDVTSYSRTGAACNDRFQTFSVLYGIEIGEVSRSIRSFFILLLLLSLSFFLLFFSPFRCKKKKKEK